MIRAVAAFCALTLSTLLPACAPIPLADAERMCISDARLAQHPRGTVAFGVGSGGYAGAGVGLEISSDYLLGHDPDQVYAACVRNRAGQLPSQPFSSLPESRM